MDKSKKRSMTGCKQRAATSKGSKTKVEVYRHFDPALKSRSFGADDFPEVVVEEKASRRSAGSPTTKMKKMQKPSTGNCYEIRICTEKRSSSSDRKESKAKMSSASSSSSYLVTKKTLNDNEDKGKKKKTSGRGSLLRLSSTETASKQPSAQLSLCSAKLKELICACDSKNRTRSKHEPAQFPCSAISDVDSKLVIYRDPIVEKIKEEIGMSAQFCNDEVKQTVAELKEEIAKYRKTLHRNVNYLQTKVKSGLSLDRRFKENAIQTEPSPNLDNMEKFGELVTKIAEMLHIDDGKPIDLLMAPRPQKVVSTSTETSPPSRENKFCQQNPIMPSSSQQSTETDANYLKQHVAVDNPKDFLNVYIDKCVNFNYLEQQKDNITKLDDLIKRTQESLSIIKRSLSKRESPQLTSIHRTDKSALISVSPSNSSIFELMAAQRSQRKSSSEELSKVMSVDVSCNIESVSINYQTECSTLYATPLCSVINSSFINSASIEESTSTDLTKAVEVQSVCLSCETGPLPTFPKSVSTAIEAAPLCNTQIDANLNKDDEIIGNVEKKIENTVNDKKTLLRSKSQNCIGPYDDCDRKCDTISCHSDISLVKSSIRTESLNSTRIESIDGLV